MELAALPLDALASAACAETPAQAAEPFDYDVWLARLGEASHPTSPAPHVPSVLAAWNDEPLRQENAAPPYVPPLDADDTAAHMSAPTPVADASAIPKPRAVTHPVSGSPEQSSASPAEDEDATGLVDPRVTEYAEAAALEQAHSRNLQLEIKSLTRQLEFASAELTRVTGAHERLASEMGDVRAAEQSQRMELREEATRAKRDAAMMH
eukprot:1283923-Prymnesium_polylepis.1